MPAKIREDNAKKGAAINDPDMYAKTINGEDSFQITMLQASSVAASVISGKLTAKIQMVGKVLQPLYIPKATAHDSGMDIDFTATMYGAWVEALYMNAEVVQGPPLALTKTTVNQVYAGYSYSTGKCLNDFLNICSNALNKEMTKQKPKMEQNMVTEFHQAM